MGAFLEKLLSISPAAWAVYVVLVALFAIQNFGISNMFDALGASERQKNGLQARIFFYGLTVMLLAIFGAVMFRGVMK